VPPQARRPPTKVEEIYVHHGEVEPNTDCGTVLPPEQLLAASAEVVVNEDKIEVLVVGDKGWLR